MTKRKLQRSAQPAKQSKHRLLKLSSQWSTDLNYVFLTLFVGLVLLWRFPNNVLRSNFYGEDGSVYLQNIINDGWLNALVTPFNGYSILGLYLLEALGWVLNSIFGQGSLLSLPFYFALVSILFMAAVIALPYLLFKSTFGSLKMLIVVLFGALVPLPTSPHIVIGTVGNQKWMFMYLATLLVIYRLLYYKQLKPLKRAAIDGVILLCAYTNSTVYALIPLLFIPYLVEAWRGRNQSSLLQSTIRKIFQKEAISLIIMSVLLLPQVIYVVLNGIPALPGYLDTPYQIHKTIEVFVNRTYIFGITHSFNGHMGDIAAMILFIILLIVGFLKLKGREKLVFFVSIYAAGIASLLFVANRRGVTDFFAVYNSSGSGPDQFFYIQTLIMYLPIVLAASACIELINHVRMRTLLATILVIFIVVSGLYSNRLYGDLWRNASVFENHANTFIDQAIVACGSQKTSDIRIVVYPYPDGRFSIKVPRDEVCTDRLQEYQRSYQSFGLIPYNNTYRTVLHSGDFYQTFKSGQDGLDGIRIFISDFGNNLRKGSYRLELYDSSCRSLLRTSLLPTTLMDNTYYNARFEPLTSSRGQTYCFTIAPPSIKPFDPIAIQESGPEIYSEGELRQRGQNKTSDVVFELLYTQTRR